MKHLSVLINYQWIKWLWAKDQIKFGGEESPNNPIEKPLL